MVKTVKGLLSLEELRGLLTEHARSLPNYKRIESETIRIDFYKDRIRIELREPKEEKCYYCDGTGKHYNFETASYDEKPCSICNGTGVMQTYEPTTARIRELREGMLKIEVDTLGTNPEVWKPDVEKIKRFIEKLAGKPCVVIPTRRKKKPRAIDISEILRNTKTLDSYS